MSGCGKNCDKQRVAEKVWKSAMLNAARIAQNNVKCAPEQKALLKFFSKLWQNKKNCDFFDCGKMDISSKTS